MQQQMDGIYQKTSWGLLPQSLLPACWHVLGFQKYQLRRSTWGKEIGSACTQRKCSLMCCPTDCTVLRTTGSNWKTVFFSPKPFHWAWDLISTASYLSYCVLSVLESGSSSQDVGRRATLWSQHCLVNRGPRAREGCRRLTCCRPLSGEELACLDL